ncbi:uncharacterized protein LOC131952043 [Physella acuta]|uniref:uncharacterized protein LOC131952043 n=1 Tax=Physella acuta TaxID=109671 RepID=UPI0027DE3ED4|nr:uncharacterized protein LOC131952043 [Physella acuta]
MSWPDRERSTMVTAHLLEERISQYISALDRATQMNDSHQASQIQMDIQQLVDLMEQVNSGRTVDSRVVPPSLIIAPQLDVLKNPMNEISLRLANYHKALYFAEEELSEDRLNKIQTLQQSLQVLNDLQNRTKAGIPVRADELPPSVPIPSDDELDNNAMETLTQRISTYHAALLAAENNPGDHRVPKIQNAIRKLEFLMTRAKANRPVWKRDIPSEYEHTFTAENPVRSPERKVNKVKLKILVRSLTLRVSNLKFTNSLLQEQAADLCRKLADIETKLNTNSTAPDDRTLTMLTKQAEDLEELAIAEKKMTTDQAIEDLALVETRLSEYKVATFYFKEKKQQDEALKHFKVVKMLESMKAALEKGEHVDKTKIPKSPGFVPVPADSQFPPAYSSLDLPTSKPDLVAFHKPPPYLAAASYSSSANSPVTEHQGLRSTNPTPPSPHHPYQGVHHPVTRSTNPTPPSPHQPSPTRTSMDSWKERVLSGDSQPQSLANQSNTESRSGEVGKKSSELSDEEKRVKNILKGAVIARPYEMLSSLGFLPCQNGPDNMGSNSVMSYSSSGLTNSQIAVLSQVRDVGVKSGELQQHVSGGESKGGVVVKRDSDVVPGCDDDAPPAYGSDVAVKYAGVVTPEHARDVAAGFATGFGDAVASDVATSCARDTTKRSSSGVEVGYARDVMTGSAHDVASDSGSDDVRDVTEGYASDVETAGDVAPPYAGEAANSRSAGDGPAVAGATPARDAPPEHTAAAHNEAAELDSALSHNDPGNTVHVLDEVNDVLKHPRAGDLGHASDVSMELISDVSSTQSNDVSPVHPDIVSLHTGDGAPQHTADSLQHTNDGPQHTTESVTQHTNDDPQHTTESFPQFTKDVSYHNSDAILQHTSESVPQHMTDVPQHTTDVPQHMTDVPQHTTDVPQHTTEVPQHTSNPPTSQTSAQEHADNITSIHTATAQQASTRDAENSGPVLGSSDCVENSINTVDSVPGHSTSHVDVEPISLPESQAVNHDTEIRTVHAVNQRKFHQDDQSGINNSNRELVNGQVAALQNQTAGVESAEDSRTSAVFTSDQSFASQELTPNKDIVQKSYSFENNDFPNDDFSKDEFQDLMDSMVMTSSDTGNPFKSLDLSVGRMSPQQQGPASLPVQVNKPDKNSLAVSHQNRNNNFFTAGNCDPPVSSYKPSSLSSLPNLVNGHSFQNSDVSTTKFTCLENIKFEYLVEAAKGTHESKVRSEMLHAKMKEIKKMLTCGGLHVWEDYMSCVEREVKDMKERTEQTPDVADVKLLCLKINLAERELMILRERLLKTFHSVYYS